MHLRSRNLPKPSASSPLDNRAPPMANASQVPNLEGLHHEIHGMAEQMRVMNENNARLIQLLVAANPNPQQHHPSLMSSDLATLIVQGIVLTTSVPNEQGIGIEHQVRPYVKGAPLRNLVKRDPELDAINTGTNAPITVDALVRQTDPPFTERVLRTRISSKFKLPTQLGIYEGKTDPMDHLDSYKSLMSSRAVLDVEDPSDKVIIMAMMEGLRPGPLFDSLSKNVPETLSALQSKADKYIAAEELAEAKCRRRGKEDHKRKEPDTRRADYREEMRYKRPDLTEIPNDPIIGVLVLRPADLSSIYHHSTPPSPKYSRRLSTRNLSNGLGRSRLTPRRGTGTNIVNSTGTTDTIPRIVFS
ncbi:hypothetical protein Acr_05g0007110 [Actinidia rufa]|uniref:Uncharacterized protein n=1 Tax=Actinidia rufa TaxID=165716 RepID=A0A7J0EL96_9ERIC|nr:hypothetical protein Acr_05g0007110 [Actinidia rufa]